MTGTASKRLILTRIKEAFVPVAPLDDQRRIVAEIEEQFTRLDAGVAAMRRVQANLKRYRAAVLKVACEGRLVPTEAELARKEGRNYETGEQLLQWILSERRKRWTESNAKNGNRKYSEPAAPDTGSLPTIPHGWVWATIEQLSILVQYGSSARTNANASGVPVLRMGNIEDGRLMLDSLKYLPKSHDEFPDLILKTGDLLFNRTNSADLVGKTAVFRGTPEPCSFASYLIRVCFCEDYLPDMAAYFLNSVFGRAW